MLKLVPSTRPWDVRIFLLHNIIDIVHTKPMKTDQLNVLGYLKLKENLPRTLKIHTDELIKLF